MNVTILGKEDMTKGLPRPMLGSDSYWSLCLSYKEHQPFLNLRRKPWPGTHLDYGVRSS